MEFSETRLSPSFPIHTLFSFFIYPSTHYQTSILVRKQESLLQGVFTYKAVADQKSSGHRTPVHTVSSLQWKTCEK